MQCPGANPKFLCPSRQALSSSFVGDKPIVSRVSLLIFWVNPSAIFLEIAFRVIYSIKSFTCWPIPHIGKEIIKLEPTATDCNSAPAIPVEVWGRDVETSIFHHRPSGIGWGCVFPFLPARMTVAN